MDDGEVDDFKTDFKVTISAPDSFKDVVVAGSEDKPISVVSVGSEDTSIAVVSVGSEFMSIDVVAVGAEYTSIDIVAVASEVICEATICLGPGYSSVVVGSIDFEVVCKDSVSSLKTTSGVSDGVDADTRERAVSLWFCRPIVIGPLSVKFRVADLLSSSFMAGLTFRRPQHGLDEAGGRN